MTDLLIRQHLFRRTQSGAFIALMCLLFAALSSLSHANEMLHWKDAWVRSMPPGAQVSAAYGLLMNHGDQTVTLSTVSSDISGTAEMHEVIADGDQRRMAELESIDIAPHETLIFEPGGRHIMLLDIAAPPVEGETVEICAVSAAGTRACTEAAVRRQATEAQESHANHH
jgi:copper(I)-binding protein